MPLWVVLTQQLELREIPVPSLERGTAAQWLPSSQAQP